MHHLKWTGVLALILVLVIFSASFVVCAAPPSRPWATPDALDAQPPASSSGTTPAVATTAVHQAASPGTPSGFSGQRPLVIRLKYLRTDQAKNLLTMLIPEDRIRIEPTNNTIIILGSDDDYDQVKDLLSRVDAPPRQVMFEAEIIEISLDDNRSIGINWGDSHILPSTKTGIITTNIDSTGASTSTNTINIGAARVRLGIKNHPELGFDLQATINHKISENKARVLASPRIATLDGQTASIIIGDKLAVLSTQVVGSSTITSVNYIDVNIKLEVTPQINDDGTITTHLKPEVSNSRTLRPGW